MFMMVGLKILLFLLYSQTMGLAYRKTRFLHSLQGLRIFHDHYPVLDKYEKKIKTVIDYELYLYFVV